MSSELSQLLELLGEDATLKIVEAYGGTRCLVPKVVPREHELIQLLGEGGFALLWEYFGGSELLVPMARRWRFEIYTKRKMTGKEIARLCGCTEMNYYRWKRRAADERQAVLEF